MIHREIHFFVPGPPVPKARPRVCRDRAGRPRTYTPKTTTLYENLVKLSLLDAVGADLAPHDAAVELHVTLTFQMPRSYPQWKQKRASRIAHIRKPDADNVLKAIIDGLTGVAFTDDARIVKCSVAKCYGEPPGAEISLSFLAPDKRGDHDSDNTATD